MICTGCAGSNTQGELNNGKPTYSFDAPILEHMGRLVDSSSTRIFQNVGIRTVRAGQVRLAPTRNRIYVQLGEAVGVYALDRFFTGELAEPMQPVSVIDTGSGSQYYTLRGNELEKVHDPDGLFYVESDRSGWSTTVIDASRMLWDFDVDDRGYFYVSTIYFGWGIARENPNNDGEHLPFVVQFSGSASNLFTLRDGDMYYAAASDDVALTLFDVTTPASPVRIPTRTRDGVRGWAKNDRDERIATLGSNGVIRVYAYSGFVADHEPLVTLTPASGKSFADLVFDEAGNLWAAETSSNPTATRLWKLKPTGNGYTSTAFDLSGTFRAAKLHVGAGYIAVAEYGTSGHGLQLFRLTAAGPEPIDTDGFFRNYYSVSLPGYAVPNWRYSTPVALLLMRQGDATYLLFNAHGLGDAYRLATLPPAIISLSPTSGIPSGGTAVTLETVNVSGDVSVTFGGVHAASITVEEGRIIATAPPHAPATVDVNVIANGVTLTAPQQFTYRLEAPASFTATAAGAASIGLTWNAVEGATQYEISRRGAGNADWIATAMTPNLSFTDGAVTSSSSYAYRIRAVDSNQYTSDYARDIATTVPFTTTTITPGTRIERAHVEDIRRGASALRAAAGLSEVSLSVTDYVTASDIGALMTALSEARAVLGFSSSFGSSPQPGTTIRATHFQQLVDVVR